jgi:hypothetical protein
MDLGAAVEADLGMGWDLGPLTRETSVLPVARGLQSSTA